MDYLPKDPAILVSSVNMHLRDEEFDTLESLCYNFGAEPKDIKDYLYGYDSMDEYILEDVLLMRGVDYTVLEKLVGECASRVYNTLRHQNIEPGTKEAFNAYVSCLHQLIVEALLVHRKRLHLQQKKFQINTYMIHIINEQGQKEAIPASNSLNEKVNRNVTVDLEWYKEHGYCSADEFFSKMRSKYNYDTTI